MSMVSQAEPCAGDDHIRSQDTELPEVTELKSVQVLNTGRAGRVGERKKEGEGEESLVTQPTLASHSVLLPQSPVCWDCRCLPPQPAINRISNFKLRVGFPASPSVLVLRPGTQPRVWVATPLTGVQCRMFTLCFLTVANYGYQETKRFYGWGSP